MSIRTRRLAIATCASFDVTSTLNSYKGQTIQVYFLGTTDSSLVSDFFVDDVQLNVTH